MLVPRPRELPWMLSAVLLAACGSTERPYQHPEAKGTSSSAYCDNRVYELPLAADEPMDDGSPRQLADAFGGTFKVPMQWAPACLSTSAECSRCSSCGLVCSSIID